MFLKDILGQERVIGFLKQALANDQMPHALLFLGNEGVGKESTALALAQVLNCENRQPDQDACGQCRSCRLFATGSHPDFWQISPVATRRSRLKLSRSGNCGVRWDSILWPAVGGWCC